MKLYEMAIAPNPRRVRMFLAEKGLLGKVQRVELDLQKGDNLKPEFIAKNPMKKVPMLELDDGTCISETMAICRYFEEAHPETQSLLGDTAVEKALVEQWLRWIDFYLFLPTGMSFQHGSGYFDDRMNCIKEWAQDCHAKVIEFFDFLDNHLTENDYICCQRFTAADINAYTTVQFAKVIGVRISSEQKNLQAWHDRIHGRDTANA